MKEWREAKTELLKDNKSWKVRNERKGGSECGCRAQDPLRSPPSAAELVLKSTDSG